MTRRRILRLALTLLLVCVAWFLREYTTETGSRPDSGSPSVATGQAGQDALARAIADRLSGVQVTAAGIVSRTLPDDDEGSRHQRFLLELPDGRTVLVSHNIDLAPRVPVQHGDAVTVHGQFEWNERGGVIHWTHHDPRGRHEDGYIEHRGRRYG